MEHLYDKAAPTKFYARRGGFLAKLFVNLIITSAEALAEFGESIPPQVMHPSENILMVPRASGASRPLKRTYALLGKLHCPSSSKCIFN
jgi:hypothetical protein